MKTSIILILIAALVGLLYEKPRPQLEIAIYNLRKLERRVGKDVLLQIEYKKRHKDAVAYIFGMLSDRNDAILKADSIEGIETVKDQWCYFLISKKIYPVKHFSDPHSNKGHAYLKALIKKNFTERYPLILEQSEYRKLLNKSLHKNISYIDITNEIALLVRLASPSYAATKARDPDPEPKSE